MADTILLDPNTIGLLNRRDLTEMSDLGTALTGYVPEDLLKLIDVDSRQTFHDAAFAVRKSSTFPHSDMERAAHMIMAPEVKEFLSSSGPSIVAVDGNFDPTQMGHLSPLSYVCAMISQVLRQQSQQYAASSMPGTPVSPQPEKGPPSCSVVLEYFCAMHISADDGLRGAQGLMRCLATQLILSLVVNEWIGQADPVHLPHLRDGEEELIGQKNLVALCRLFAALVRLVPHGVAVYCVIDSWSVFERETLGRDDYDVALNGFREIIDEAAGPDGGANFKLLVTSATSGRWLEDFLLPGQIVSLRQGEGKAWHGVGRGGLMGLARVATMPDTNHGFGGRIPVDEYGRPIVEDTYDRRFSP